MDGDINLGSVYSSFTVPAAWDHAELAQLEGLEVQMEVQAIQAASSETRPFEEGWPGVAWKAWNNWGGENAQSELVPAAMLK